MGQTRRRFSSRGLVLVVQQRSLNAGGTPPQLVLDNEVINRDFFWSIGPKSEELLLEELELGVNGDAQFPRLLEDSEPMGVDD